MEKTAAKDLVDRIKFQHENKILSWEEEAQNKCCLLVDKKDLPEVCNYLNKKLDGRLFTMTGNDERDLNGNFALYYVFSFDQEHSFITIKTLIDPQDPTFPSTANDLPATNWYEREVRDLLGLQPVGHPDPRPLIVHGDWPEDIYPLRKDFPVGQHVPRVENRDSSIKYESEDVTIVPVGPIHAGIIEPGHFSFGTVGDTVLHLDAKLFFTHRGLEKVSEGMPFSKALFVAERICGVCALSHSTAFAQAIENAGEVQIPLRARSLRTLFLELERLYNHIGDVGNIGAGFGFSVVISAGSRLKEELQQLNERIAGHRYLRGVVTLGGTRVDLTQRDCTDIRMTLRRIKQELNELADILLNHEIAVNRMATTGVLRLQVAEDLEVVGVAARASGRNVDIRRDQPYAAYDRVKFQVPIFKEGDVMSLIRILIQEVFQSFSIIEQVLDQLTDGKIVVKIPEIKPYQISMGWCESPRGESVHWIMTGPNQTIYRYRVRSATYSNWPAVGSTVPGNIVPDFPLINKSFELCYSCCDR
ncbi:MAG: NADH-quinone oxidoreductase subunit C [Bacillota bacterium]|nr:NADH-quinone oxidoreductase subunit C [Bacillota bacterium]